jgi:hypothetical protein
MLRSGPPRYQRIPLDQLLLLEPDSSQAALNAVWLVDITMYTAAFHLEPALFLLRAWASGPSYLTTALCSIKPPRRAISSHDACVRYPGSFTHFFLSLSPALPSLLPASDFSLAPLSMSFSSFLMSLSFLSSSCFASSSSAWRLF